jgi:HAD superfamily hydrolase (TIGR01490 family)
MMATLAIFDLDHTLLSGDSDVLWCQFLVAQGLLPASQLVLNARMEAAYRSGTVSATAFSQFYVSQLGGHSPEFWAPWCARFLHDEVLPRIPASARALVQEHRSQGHTLVLSTATNRVITALTAAALHIPHLIATEVELAGGAYTGRTAGVLNMREGKLQRLRAWLADHGLDEAGCAQALADARFYSDSINDLPLLAAVGHAVVVDPDERLLAEARARGWPVLQLDRAA